MEFQITLIVSVALLLLAIYTGLAQLRAHLAAVEAEDADDEQEARFRRNQFRRRFQVSLMLALLAVGLFLGQFIPIDEYPTFFVAYWCGMALLVLWIGVLAMADLFSVRRRAARLSREYHVQEARLRSEYRRLSGQAPPEKPAEGNGDSQQAG